ncbi:MAG: radical SAM protein [Candidatus Hodarchaeota archaeon]
MQRNAMQDNKRLSEKEFLERRVKLECFPQQMAIYATDTCNIRCVECDYGQKVAPRLSINEEGYQRVLDVFPFAERVGIAGAEMFYDEGNPGGYAQKIFDEGMKHPNLRFVGFTNGTLLTPERITLIVKKFKWIGVSIDSPDPNTYKTIRVGSNLHHIIRNIKKISERKAEIGLGRSDSPEIVVSSVISERTFKSVVEMVDLAHEIGALGVHFQAPWEGTYVNENIFMDREKTKEYLALRKQAANKAGDFGIFIVDRTINSIVRNMPEHKELFETPGNLVRDKWPNCCDSPWTELYIWRNGDVKVCCTSNTVLGNINHNSIYEIWNSPEILKLRRRILKGNYAKDCQSNCHRGYLLPHCRRGPLSQLIANLFWG